MRGFSLILFLLISLQNSYGQNCPNLISPLNSETNLAVDATIRWESIQGVTGYIVSLGTTDGGGEIVNEQANGNSTFIKPSTGLPENTRIYVTITLFFFDRPNIRCASQSFVTENVLIKPDCTSMESPINGATNVNVAANIRWSYASKATGYLLSIGRTPGGTEILNNFDVGNVLSFDPPNDFTPDTKIYIRIVPYNENGSATNCTEESFNIGAIAQLPGCTNLISPIDGATNVPLSPFVEWESVPGATGYRVFIGKSPIENDILDGGNFSNTSTFVFNFESNNVYFIRIIPYNAAGLAMDCQQQSFSTILGCGPYYSQSTGELVTLNPEISFPEKIGICSGESEVLTSNDEAEGYRWYSVGQFDDTLISSDQNVSISQPGLYLLELYNYTEDNQIECSSFKEFEVLASEAAIIEDVRVEEQASGLNIRVTVSGNGDYEYAIDSAEGPYQTESIFLNAPLATEVIYVKDKNGCGIIEYQLQFSSINKGFPKFFTPNGDGYNDTWQYISKANDNFTLLTISVFDRYGKLIKTINPTSRGWDGKVNGQGLPSNDYWYSAVASNGRVFTGHFTLKR